MRLIYLSVAIIVTSVTLLISGSKCRMDNRDESSKVYQQLEEEWIKQTDSSKIIPHELVPKWISMFWDLRKQYPNTVGATKATVKAFKIAEVTHDYSALDTLFNEVSLHENAMVELVKYIPSQTSSDNRSIAKWEKIARTSRNSKVRAAALFQIILIQTRNGQNIKTAILLDSLQSQYGIAENHKRYGTRIQQIQQQMALQAVGKKLSNFSTTDINGTQITFNDFEGKITLLYFHGTGCGSCIKMYPKLNQIYERYKENNFFMLGIAADGAYYSEERFRSYLKKYSIQWPQTLNIDLFNLYKVNFLSTAFLLNRKGEIIRTSRSDKTLQSTSALDEKSLEESIDYLINL